MRKRIWIPLLLLAVLAGGLLWYGIANTREYDAIATDPWNAPAFPAVPAYMVSVAVGPGGISEAGAPEDTGRHDAFLAALRGTAYLALPPSLPMGDGGILVEDGGGCLTAYAAYWTGRLLWLPVEGGQWRPYLPLHAGALDEQINGLRVRYGYRIP